MSRIDELREKIKSLQFVDKEEVFRLTNELLNVAKEENEYDLICLAYSKLSTYAFLSSDFTKSKYYAYQAIDIAKKHNLTAPVSQAHSMLGILFTKQNNEPEAIKHFHEALAINLELENYSELSVVYTNLGEVYLNLSDYDTALSYYEKGAEFIEKKREQDPTITNYDYHKMIQNLNRALIYAKQGNKELLDETIKLIDEHKGKEMYSSVIQFINVLNAISAYFAKDYELFFENTEIVIKTAPMITYGLDLLKEYLNIFDYLVELKAFNQAQELQKIIEKIAVGTKSNSILAESYSRKFSLYRTLNYKDRFSTLLPKYLSALDHTNYEMDELQRVYLSSYLNLEKEKNSKKAIQKKLATLEHQSSYDALTSLPNRSFLNIYCDSAFASCLESKTTLGVVVVDIDNFKGYNDSYGHLAGDYCILKVANVLKKCTRKYFVARFGGDEFFIIAKDVCEEEIIKLCENIQESLVSEIEPELNKSMYEMITLSFGYYISIPTSIDDKLSCVSNADKALYLAKSKGKNCISRYEA